MRSHSPRGRRRLVPSFHALEERRLLSLNATNGGQSGLDFVGPNMSPGSDGIADVDIKLSGLLSGLSTSDYVQEIEITSQTQQGVPLEWETNGIYGNGGATTDSGGFSQAAFFYTVQPVLSGSNEVPIPSTGDLYINPEVNALDTVPAGQGTPESLGGSTGPLECLQDGDVLNITVTYANLDVDTYQLTLDDLTSATDPATPAPTPSDVDFSTASASIQDDGQDGTGPESVNGWQGFVHLVLTAPSGVTFNSSEFLYGNINSVAFELTDELGNEWDSTANQQWHNDIYGVLQAGSDNVVNLYFLPRADEAPTNGSNAPDMTLQIILPGSTVGSPVYAVQFVGQDWNLALMDQPDPASYAQESTTADSGAALQADINDGYGTIYLPAGKTIYSSLPIQITNSVTIIGQGATLEFDQDGDTWPDTADGALYVSDIDTYGDGVNTASLNMQITLEDFTIEFAPNAPLSWATPAGTLYDPESPNNGSLQLAVINDTSVEPSVNNVGIGTLNYATDTINLERMAIYGPPAWDAGTDGSNFTYLQNLLQTPTINGGAGDDNVHTYIGEPAIFLVDTDATDNGTFTQSTFQGGQLFLGQGPWVITDNHFLGATNYTYSLGAIAIAWSNGSLVEGNTLVQQATDGFVTRFINFAGEGYDNTVEDNTAGGGAGLPGQATSYDDANGFNDGGGFYGTVGPLNSPEFFLEESTYGVAFEGSTEAVSSDGYLLVLPNFRGGISSLGDGGTGADLVVSILTGPDAGEWFPVAQQVAGSGNTLELLMEDPLPQFPDKQAYTIEITGGNFVDDSFIGNSIDLTNMVSTGIDLGSNSFGVRIIDNNITGGSSMDSSITGTGILLSVASNSPAGGAYPIPNLWTDLPDLGAVIEGNVIRNALGGIDVVPGSVVSDGRTYLTATIVDNTFEWNQAFLSSWLNVDYSATGSSPGDAYNDPDDPMANRYPPTVTIGGGFTAFGYWNYSNHARDPAGVGNILWAGNAPAFVDPGAVSVDLSDNPAEIINADGSITPQTGDTGQIYAGIVNGVLDTPTLPEGSFQGRPYYVFNLLNLDVDDQASVVDGIQALMVGQDNYDLVGAGSGPPEPDGTQDLHLELTGLSTTATISSITITDNADDEEWVYPESASSPQIVFDYGAGSTTADIFIQPSAAVYDGSFTIDVTYADGSPIAIPVGGVSFEPNLPVASFAPPQAPVDFSATAITSSAISLSWTSVPGATSYELEQWLSSDPSDVTTIDVAATDSASMSYVDSGLAGNTSYDYQLIALSSLSLNGIPYDAYSPVSLMATATTPPTDALDLTSVSWSTTAGISWTGTVATFTDVNTLTPESSFSATVYWGDETSSTGAVSGSGGSFTVTAGPHTYASTGSYKVTVQVDLASASINDTTSGTVTVSPSSSAPAPAQVDLNTASSSGGTVFNAYGITGAGSPDQNGLNYYNYSYLSTALGSSVNWDGQTFDFGAADTPNVFNTGGASIYPAQGSYTNLLILGGAVLGTQSVQITVFYTNNTSTTYDQDFSDWMGGYTGPGTTAPGESIVETMHSYDEQSQDGEVTTSGTVYLYGYNIPLEPSLIVSRIDFDNNVNQFILAVDIVNEPPQINMATSNNGGSSFNDYGITADGVSIPSVGDNYVGLINSGGAFSATELGTSATWDGQTFNFGAADTADVYAVNGAHIYFPENEYTNLMILGMAVNGPQYENITVVYADGQQVEYNQDFSDWIKGYTGPGTTAPGESIVEKMGYYDDTSGNKVNTLVYLYGYNIPLNPNEPVSNVYFDNNDNADILAVDVVNEPAQVDLETAGNADGTSSAFNAVGITTNTDTDAGNIDGHDSSYSATALGGTVTWDGQSFNLGPADENDVVDANGSDVYLPEGNYSDLFVLGAATGVQHVEITVYYADNTYVTFDQDFSDWVTGYTNYQANSDGNTTSFTTAPGESIAANMDYRNVPPADNEGDPQQDNPDGDDVYVYGYDFPLNPAETVSRVAFTDLNGDGSKAWVLAMDVVNAVTPQVNLSLPGSAPDDTSAFTPGNSVITIDNASQYGDVDSTGYSYSAKALGNTIAWDGQTFNLGGAGTTPNVAYANGSQINLPAGSYTNLLVLGAASGVQPVAITVTYTDGSQVTFDQDFSDWLTETAAPGESIAKTALYYNYYISGQDGQMPYDAYVYGYNFPIDPAKTVSYVTFSDLNDESSKAWVLAIDVVNQPSQVNLGLPSSAAPDTGYFNAVGITLDGAGQYDGANSGLDGLDDTYSANLLGTTLTVGPYTFDVGPASANDVSFVNDSSIQLPEVGIYDALILLGATTTEDETEPVTITVTYTDGSSVEFTQSFGYWLSGNAGGGYVADKMPYYNTPTGETQAAAYVYEYTFTLNPELTVSSVSFSGDPGSFVLAADVLSPSADAEGPANDAVVAGQTFGVDVLFQYLGFAADTSYDGNVTVSLANNPGGSTLGGTLTVQASDGVADFTDLTLNNPGIGYTLDLWIQGFGQGPIVSDSFDVAGYSLVASGGVENLVWDGTSGDDEVQFVQLINSGIPTNTVEINVTELGGNTGFLTEVPGVTGDVVVNEYDGCYSSDVINCSGLSTIPASITAGNGTDIIIGGGAANTIAAGDGDDTIYGNGAGNSPNISTQVQDPSNIIEAGDGNDVIYGNYFGTGYEGGDNTITAGNGSDTIYGNYGNGAGSGDGAEGKNCNTITVGNGDDTIYGNYGWADGAEGGDNKITAGNGDDVIYGNANGNATERQSGKNIIIVGDGTDTIYGNLGGDGGEGGDNYIQTGDGADTIYGNFGGDGGEGGGNIIVAGGGNDTIYAHCGLPATSTTSGTTAGGYALIIGGTGADTVYGWPSGYSIGSSTGDIFVAGTVSLSETALGDVLAEWTSSDSYTERVGDLESKYGAYIPGDGGGDDGDDTDAYAIYLLEGSTITASDAVDQIFANAGSEDDWYLVTSNDYLNGVSVADIIDQDDVDSDEITLLD